MPSTYDKIAAYTVPSATASYTFSSIPSTYTDLILVFAGNPISGGAGADIQINFNSDTATNYSRTYILGDGSTASSGRSTNATFWVPAGIYNNMNQITQIQNYSNATTYKTAISRTNIAGTYVAGTVGLWRSTAAINTIKIAAGATSFDTGSTFTLYGIKAA